MADQVIPIQDIASLGVVKDTPSIALPPNAYSDVQNIRFHAGAARKMEGEMPITTESHTNLVYALYWRAPANEYYVVVQSDGDVIAYDFDFPTTPIGVGSFDQDTAAVWQHTLFNGGFNLVLNNGVSTPQYMSAPLVAMNLAPLPNWDSYLAQENVTTVTWDEFNADIALGREVNYTTESILYSVIPRNTSVGIINSTATTEAEADLAPYTVIEDEGNWKITPRGRTDEITGALPGDTIVISIQTKAEITVRAGVIRAYGNLLIAGDLTEMDGADVVRRLPGTIRTSDVAAPGAIPLNWNPFRNGANTADEFILSSTGVVQDMAELQGVMYVYTDVSIHAIQQTGNPTVPFQISTTTDSYGCNSLGAVMEFDGRHLVVGSQDIYVFAGHPGSISSIADGKVRHYAYGDGMNDSNIDINNVRMVRNQKYDEIWIFSPNEEPEMLVWNYRTQAWTIRRQTGVVSGTQGVDSPLFAEPTQIFNGDKTFSDVGGNAYESYVARMRLGLTPEFDTETIGATAMMYTSDVDMATNSPNLEIMMRGSSHPSDNRGIGTNIGAKPFLFLGQDDYKVDTRIQGRFINYMISDGASNIFTWNITGYQLEVMKGGTR